MTTTPVYIGVDHDVLYEDATAGGSALTSGTCTYSFTDEDGAELATGAMPHVSGGDYAGVVESTVTALLTDNTVYYLEITFAQGAYNDFRRLRLKARYRGEE